MIFKESRIWISDNSGAVSAKSIHVYRSGGNDLGIFVKTVLKVFDIKKKLAKKKKYFTLVLSTKKKTTRSSGSAIRFSHLRGVLLTDREKVVGSRIYGPISKELLTKTTEAQFKELKTLSDCVV